MYSYLLTFTVFVFQMALRYAAILRGVPKVYENMFVVFFRYTVDVHVVHTTALQAYFFYNTAICIHLPFHLPLKRELKNSIFVHILLENLEN